MRKDVNMKSLRVNYRACLSIALVMVLFVSFVAGGCDVQTPSDTGTTTTSPQLQASDPSNPTETPETDPSSAPTDPNQSDATQPSETEPPVTEPSETEPPVTEPPVTEPPATEPPVTEPPVTEPPEPVKDYYTAEDYLANPDLFVPKWSKDWQPPAEMLDFEEKYASIMDPNGRLMSIGHRADRNQYYPENSIEGILSCIMAGVDMVELDIAVTKDGVLVLMHDADLVRTTDVTLLRGQGVQGLPETDLVSDWTLEQLRQLRLLRGNRLTNYVIPTLEEAIMVCKGRCFITLDKQDRFSWTEDVYPLVQKHEAYREVLVPYNYNQSLGISTLKKYLDQIEKDSGYKPFFMARCNINASSLKQVTNQLLQYDICPSLRPAGCEYNPEVNYLYKPYIGKFRIHIETISSSAGNDTLETWKKIDADGFNLLMTNNPYGLSQYIAQQYFA